MYLRKYQVGGIAYTPYLAPQAGSTQESTTTTSGGSSSKSDSPDKITGTIKKEIINLLKENGIPSDVSTFLSVANNFLGKSAHLSTSSLFGGTDDDYDISDLIKVQQLVNDVKYNKGLKDKALANLTKEGAGNEVAVTSDGRMYVQTEDGNLKKIRPEEYANNESEYNPLTNSQLLYYREHNNGLSFDTSILNDIGSAIGMESVMDYIKNTIKAFGTDEVAGYATKDQPLVRGMQALMEAGPDGYYKVKDKEQLRDMNHAIAYIWNSLSKSAKNLLDAKTAAEGGDPSKPEDRFRLIVMALQEHTSKSLSADFDEGATKYDPRLSKAKGGSGSESLTHDTYPEALVSGDGLNPAQYINIMPSNTGVTLHAYSQDAGPILKNKEDRMNTTNLQVVLTDAYGVSGVTNAQSVTFGDQLIDSSEYKNVMIDGFTDMQRVYLPIKIAPDGRITPNFEAQQKLEKVQEYIANQKGVVSDTWIKDWLAENLPEAVWNSETKQVEFNTNYVKPFLVFHGVAARNRVTFNSDSPYLHHLSNDEGKNLKDSYKRVVSSESIMGKLENVGGEGAARWKYYSGNVYVPISGPTTGSLIYNHQYFPKSTYMDITQKATANQTRQQLKTNF